MEARVILTTSSGKQVEGYGQTDHPPYALGYAVSDAYEKLFGDSDTDLTVIKLEAVVE